MTGAIARGQTVAVAVPAALVVPAELVAVQLRIRVPVATVRIVSLEPRRPRYDLAVTGEELRTQFEARLDAREPDEAAA